MANEQVDTEMENSSQREMVKQSLHLDNPDQYTAAELDMIRKRHELDEEGEMVVIAALAANARSGAMI